MGAHESAGNSKTKHLKLSFHLICIPSMLKQYLYLMFSVVLMANSGRIKLLNRGT